MPLKNITNIKKTGIGLIFLFVFALSFFIFPIDNTSAGIDCAVANTDDCDCNGTCETDTSSDMNNCGACGVVCGGGSCVNGSCTPVVGGLVPCGRLFDSPGTAWNEEEPCKICHAVPLANNIIDYLVGIVGLITVLAIVIGGALYVSSAGDASRATIAKTAVTKSLHGFVFVLTAWVIVNVGMVIFGFDDPFGDGSWAKFNCDIATGPLVATYCGDGVVQVPNDDGDNEDCDPKETWYNFTARGGGTKEQWVESIYRCNPTDCSLGCAGDPLVGSIGEGCYLDPIGLPCKKGRYVCDSGTDTVICADTFSDVNYKIGNQACNFTGIYDYCCDNDIPSLLALDFTIERTTTPINTPYRCDDLCKTFGKVCVGVGLMDPVNYSCLSIIDNNVPKTTCDDGVNTYNCNNLVNIAGNDCRANFNIRMVTDCVECYDSDFDGLTESFYFGVWETACYCL